MTQANQSTQGAIENLIEIVHIQREASEQMGQRMDAGFAKLTARQEHLTQTVDNLGLSTLRLSY